MKNNNKWIIDLLCRTKVDTMQLCTPVSNITKDKQNKMFIEDGYPWLIGRKTSYKWLNGEQYITMVMNPTRKLSRNCIDKQVYQLTFTKGVLAEMALELDVKLERIQNERIDIAFDLDKEYKQIKGLARLIGNLYCLQKKCKANIISDSITDNKTGVFVKQRYHGLNIYDKYAESGGLHPYGTRIEFKLMKAHTETNLLLDETLKKMDDLLLSLPKNFEQLEQLMAKQLISDFERYKLEKPKARLQEFMTDEERFFSQDVCRMVYETTGSKTEFKVWLSKTKKKQRMELYSKEDIEKLIEVLRSALDNYIKS